MEMCERLKVCVGPLDVGLESVATVQYILWRSPCQGQFIEGPYDCGDLRACAFKKISREAVHNLARRPEQWIIA
jgi:hypothetical protein